MRKILLFTLLFASGTFFVTAQSQPVSQDKSELEKEREELQRELKEIQSMYTKVKGQTKQTLGQLNILNRKIALQESYINNINRELRSIDDDIYMSNIEIYRLQKQFDTLKIEYARTVVYAYKNRSNYDYLNFIFSAGSFNDALKRVSYLKNLRAYREKQVNTILETQELIAKRKKQQLTRKVKKNEALENQTKQVKELAVQKREKNAVVSQLKLKEKDLQKEINAKKKRDKDLKNAITAIVRREIEAAKKSAEAKVKAEARANPVTVDPTTTTNPSIVSTRRNEAVKKPESYLNLNANDIALNSSFQANKARLPWPVDNGVVTVRFGTNKIENTHLTFDNPGLTIATPSSGVTVKAVFDGEVSAVYNLGDGMAITVRHGKYFTTYSNLSGVTVTKGTEIKTGQQIGRAGRDEEGSGGQIDFILMIETKNVDPMLWLRR